MCVPQPKGYEMDKFEMEKTKRKQRKSTTS